MKTYLSRDSRAEALCLLLLLATGVALLVGAASLPDPMFDPLGPAGLPRYLGYLMLALVILRIPVLLRENASNLKIERQPPGVNPKAVSLLGAGERGIPRADDADRPQVVRFLLVAAITLAYLTALSVGGLPFIWLTLVFLAALGAALSDATPRRLATVAAIAVVMSFALTYTFADLLSVVLPE